MQFHLPVYDKKGPVTVAISSGGASPVLTRLLKDRMKQVLPEQTEGIAEQLGNLRKEIFPFFRIFPQREPLFLQNWQNWHWIRRKL